MYLFLIPQKNHTVYLCTEGYYHSEYFFFTSNVKNVNVEIFTIVLSFYKKLNEERITWIKVDSKRKAPFIEDVFCN